MSKKKTGLILKIVLCILILLVVLCAVVIILIDPIAKNALEKGAPLVLGTTSPWNASTLRRSKAASRSRT